MFEGEGVIYQNCYIVDNLDQALAAWTTNIGAGPFFVQRDLKLEIEYRGKPSPIHIDLAIGQAGAVHIELIEVHSKNPTVYTDLRPKGHGGFHHVGLLAKDFEGAIAAYRKAGFEVGMKGMFGQTPFAYIDTCSSLGFFTEFHEDTPEIRGMFKRIAAAQIGWDKSRPIRPMAEILPWLAQS